jgi:hypothetical protein
MKKMSSSHPYYFGSAHILSKQVCERRPGHVWKELVFFLLPPEDSSKNGPNPPISLT